MRVLVARLSHETNTFSPVPTPLARFCPVNGELLRGKAAIDQYRGTESQLGGFLQLADEEGAEIVMPVAAGARPSRPVEAGAYETLCDLILDAARTEGPFDAVLLDLHGAMVVEGYEDGEGELLRRLRTVLPDTPIAVGLDMHANLYPAMVTHATAIAGYRTYPHVDYSHTALRVGRVLMRALRGQVQPTMAWGNVPMMPSIMTQGTHQSPNRELQAMAAAMEESGEALLASVFTGFPHADISQAGLSAVVVTDGDQAKAQALVDRLLDTAWNARDAFLFQAEALEDSVARAKRLGAEGGPVVLLDHCDNTGSGGTMDTTEVLAEILRQGLQDVFFFAIYDPEAVKAAMAAGIGATISLEIGGKTPMPALPQNSRPLPVTGVVRTLSAGYFISQCTMSRGLPVRVGPMALLDLGGVDVALVSSHIEPFDPGYFLALGIDPAQRRFIALKSRVHWRADLAKLAKHVVECAGIGVCTSDHAILDFKSVRRPIFPLDSSVSRN